MCPTFHGFGEITRLVSPKPWNKAEVISDVATVPSAVRMRTVGCVTLSAMELPPPPRFEADSIETLIELATAADPPVQQGDVAELALPRGRVRVVVSEVDPFVIWDEVR